VENLLDTERSRSRELEQMVRAAHTSTPTICMQCDPHNLFDDQVTATSQELKRSKEEAEQKMTGKIRVGIMLLE